jgi:hypothetical protein
MSLPERFLTTIRRPGFWGFFLILACLSVASYVERNIEQKSASLTSSSVSTGKAAETVATSEAPQFAPTGSAKPSERSETHKTTTPEGSTTPESSAAPKGTHVENRKGHESERRPARSQETQGSAQISIIRVGAQSAISLIVLVAAFVLIFKGNTASDTKKWACGIIGLVIGFWLHS